MFKFAMLIFTPFIFKLTKWYGYPLWEMLHDKHF
jgi:hypothetical protein